MIEIYREDMQDVMYNILYQLGIEKEPVSSVTLNPRSVGVVFADGKERAPKTISMDDLHRTVNITLLMLGADIEDCLGIHMTPSRIDIGYLDKVVSYVPCEAID